MSDTPETDKWLHEQFYVVPGAGFVRDLERGRDEWKAKAEANERDAWNSAIKAAVDALCGFAKGMNTRRASIAGSVILDCAAMVGSLERKANP